VDERRGISWPLLVLALMCAIPAVVGGLWVLGGDEDYQALGFAVLGFFGAGVVVLGRKAFRPGP
jgi:hypothetical protein